LTNDERRDRREKASPWCETQDIVGLRAGHRIAGQDEIAEASCIYEAFNRLAAGGVRYRPDINASSFSGDSSRESGLT
jgi:hypothetical protein